MSLQKQFESEILHATKAYSITRADHIQSLWSGYGEIVRLHLNGGNYDSIVVKHIHYPEVSKHPRGWNTQLSHKRKVKSYEVEVNWYRNWSELCTAACRVPMCIGYFKNETSELLLLEDLNSVGFTKRKDSLTVNQAKIVLGWLANFHATHLQKEPKKLWETGTYWHLATRPDEWEAMQKCPLKEQAKTIDQSLADCQYPTIVHGDAKVANFCFNEDLTQVAAVDFQYVGGGCGMKDVAYFLGSCLSEKDCEENETELLNHYMSVLTNVILEKHPNIDVKAVEAEYRKLYPMAWADFTRFLLGWMPNHQKLNSYSKKMADLALIGLK